MLKNRISPVNGGEDLIERNSPQQDDVVLPRAAMRSRALTVRKVTQMVKVKPADTVQVSNSTPFQATVADSAAKTPLAGKSVSPAKAVGSANAAVAPVGKTGTPNPTAAAAPRVSRYQSVEKAHVDGQVITPLTRDQYVVLFRKKVEQTAKATLELCRVVYEAFKTLDEAQFEAFCSEVGYKDTSSTIRKFLAIGKVAPRLVQYSSQLPASWTSIYQLTQIPASYFEKMLNDGKSLTSLTGADVKELVQMTRDLTSITKDLPRDKLTKSPIFAKVCFTRAKIDDTDWELMKKGFAELEARLPLKFIIAENAESVYQERKQIAYDEAKKKRRRGVLDPSAWNIGLPGDSRLQEKQAA